MEFLLVVSGLICGGLLFLFVLDFSNWGHRKLVLFADLKGWLPRDLSTFGFARFDSFDSELGLLGLALGLFLRRGFALE